MRKIVLIMRHEVGILLRSKVYIFFALGLPIILTVLFGVLGVRNQTRVARGLVTPEPTPTPAVLRTEGYVDYSGLIKRIPETLPAGVLVAYPDEASAAQALERDDIQAYYLIPVDYIETGQLIYINPDYRFLADTARQDWTIRNALLFNLLEADQARLQRITNPMELVEAPLQPPEAEIGVKTEVGEGFAWYIPYGVMMLMYLVLISSASLLLSSVTTERKNRVMEVLLVSTSSRQLLTGKIVGLGLLGMLQAVIWLGAGYVSLRLQGRTLEIPPGSELPVSLLVWALLFFLLGNAFYASLLAGLGALAPNPGEANQMIFFVIWPLILPMFFYPILIEQRLSLFSILVSLFPPTAPIAMLTRLAAAPNQIPVWQPFLAGVLLALLTVGVVRVVARLFHPRTMLGNQPLKIKNILRLLRE